jgi:hypothetical protein
MNVGAAPVPAVVVVWSREECPLCDELLAELWPLLATLGLRPAVRDVDSDAIALRRYGLKVPVVEVDGVAVCHGHLDTAAVLEVLGARGVSPV